MLQKNIQSAFSLAMQNGGVSFNQTTVNPTEGFMVSFPDKGIQLNIHEFTEAKLAQYVNKNANILQSVSNAFIGVWFNTNDNMYYLDVSENLISKENALRTGMLRDQKAIFDIANNKVLELPTRQRTGTEYQKQTYLNQKVRELL